jgi:hypothetical protein
MRTGIWKRNRRIQVLLSIVETYNALIQRMEYLMTEDIKPAETDNIIMYLTDLRGLVRGELNI